MASERIIKAAGGVVWRKRTNSSTNGSSIEVLLIHRPKYDDWTLPKGKADPGESLPETAVREIYEETGLRVRLGLPLHELEYPVAGGIKRVHYWCARVIGPSGTEGFAPNGEVDEVRWERLGAASELLTHVHDRDVLERFRAVREDRHHKSRTLIVLRHAKAAPRNGYDGDDLIRPLDAVGVTQAKGLIGVLGAYGVRHVVSSPADRCVKTVEPYAKSISTFLEVDDRMFEEAKPSLVRRSLAALLERKKPTVICTHRPTMPTIFDDLGQKLVDLKPGDAVVVHHRKGTVCALEHIPA
jgi:8-oxo-dGTP pyrophosphatase MutT (NUDIX family)/phosphohistidine phosphatase SixA